VKKNVFPILLVFLCMGFGDAVGPFVGLAKNEFTLSNTMAMIIPFTGFIMFGLLSVPMGVLQDKKGKKFILIMGLTVAFVGLVIPMFGLSSFGLFLLIVLMLGAGATILQVAGNPIMRDVSEEGKYSRNLSLGQFIKAIGSMTGAVIPPIAAAWFGADWKILFPIFSISIFLTIIFVSTIKVREKKSDNEPAATLGSCLALLKNHYVLIMVIGIFVYVGAEVCMSSGIPLFLNNQFNVDIEKLGLLGTGLFFLSLTIGRFLGSVILTWMKPKKFFIITSVISAVSILGLFTGSAIIAIICVFIVGVGFANIFPLIFSITIDVLPDKANELSGLMVTAIVGGAFLPPLMGVIADNTSIVFGFVVPLAAILYVTWVAYYNYKKLS